ncbi:MAG TPA: long-chain fatty acid--CoA ligase [Thermoanaerobaculia bacterium]|nr:long-chain fatty acid--CoA ligase [Thermoanaerobaculia bacterium]HUM28579.1 long-chain fatty acid--CoA ligase [Thermoanaerobaculia bacterium]HXK66813.1 long-chain fatty acid--CoA ligase [Thermoanaerobaculia bacterium]
MNTINDIFFKAMEYNKPVHVRYPCQGVYQSFSSEDVRKQVMAIALALQDLGAREGMKIAIFCDSSYRWAFADFAIMTSRAVTVTIYPNLLPPQIAAILERAECEMIFVGNEQLLGNLLSLRDDLPSVKHMILMEGSSPEAISWDDLLSRGMALLPEGVERFEHRAKSAHPDDVATILFTSGTTGDPKGVVLTHGNILSNVVATADLFDFGSNDTAIIFLPLSHILERMVNFVYWAKGMTMGYAESIETLGKNLMEIHPTIFTAVPRMYEKMYDRVQEKARSGSSLTRRLLRVAEATAREAADYVIHRKPFPLGLSLKMKILDRLVYRKIRANLGGNLRFCIAGGAALNVHIARFFIGAGVYIFEGYGLTETSPVLAVNTFNNWKLGTVGHPLEGVEIRIAEDGEILARGPNVFQGYYRDETATRESFTEDGFFRTGDIGLVDEEGFLKITDRKKDLIVTAGGKNIAPLPIEERFKRNLYISQAVMSGDGRPYPIILLVPDFEALMDWANHSGITWEKKADLLEHPKVRQLFDGIVESVNLLLARYEQPKRYALLQEEFTIENGLLTPTQKVKRRVVAKQFQSEIDKVYAAGSS